MFCNIIKNLSFNSKNLDYIIKRLKSDSKLNTIQLISPRITKYRISPKHISKNNLIFIDTETTGLHFQSDIVQLAAISLPDHYNRNECVDIYCKPMKDSNFSNKVLGKTNKKNKQINNEIKPAKILPVNSGLEKFINFIERNRKDSDFKAILLAHNVLFDSRVLINALYKSDLLKAFNDSVIGFVDTLSLFRKCYPHLQYYSQQNLVSYFLYGQYNMHNARDDVHLLQQLYNKALSQLVHSDLSLLSKASFSVNFAVLRHKHQLRVCKNLSSFEPLIAHNILNKAIAKKLAENDLSFDVLKKTHTNCKEMSITNSIFNILGNSQQTKQYCDQIINFLKTY